LQFRCAAASSALQRCTRAKMHPVAVGHLDRVRQLDYDFQSAFR
jgi:hypothetical protein